MARSLVAILEDLEHKVVALQAEMEELRTKNSELASENSDLRKREAEAQEAKEQALLDVEYLRVSYRLAESPDSLAETRKVIAGLIRNIDRCIEMLKE